MAENSAIRPGKRLAYELALWRLEEQRSFAATLDSRLGNAVALGAAMIALLGSALLFAEGVDRAAIRPVVHVAVGLFIASTVISTLAYLTGRLRLAPNLRELMDLSEEVDDEELIALATNSLARAVEANELGLFAKSWLVNATVAITGSTAIVIAVAAIRVL